MPSVVAIFIPVFNQPHLAAECLESLTHQTFKDFEVTLVDDASTADYQPLINTFSKSIVMHYRRNPRNLGALGNMQACLKEPCAQPYKIVFHEDDAVHPKFLEYQVGQMNKNPNAVFCATGMSLAPVTRDIAAPNIGQIHYCRSALDLLKIFIRPYNFTFGSVIYRTNALKPLDFNLTRFGTLADRPYLLDQLGDREAAFIDLPLVYYRPHPAQTDKRADSLTLDHLLAFFGYYADVIARQEGDRHLKKEFLRYVTNGILEGGLRLTRKCHRSYMELLYTLYRQEKVSPWAVRPAGLKGFFRSLTTPA